MLRQMCTTLLLLSLSTTLHAATVITTDTISSPDHFMDFEGLPNTSNFGATHTEDNIAIEQVNGNPNSIWTALGRTGQEGLRAWYSNGGDNGYTKITRADNGPIGSLGLLRASGNANHTTLLYELWNQGLLIQSGSVVHQNNPVLYLGFTGGGFDEVRLRDGDAPASVADGSLNALWLDAIEIVNGSTAPAQAIPVLPPLALLLLALSLGVIGRKFLARQV